jgi:hypothetical protein
MGESQATRWASRRCTGEDALMRRLAPIAFAVPILFLPAVVTMTRAAAADPTIRVPQDAPTIQAAVDRAQPGTLVLIAPGVYREAVVVRTPDLVIRGLDRNGTILEGGFRRANGIAVENANGVAIENLTARDFLTNGIVWRGVDGYRGSYLTVYRNGAYGLYAFASQHGQLDHSYVSGSGDAGFYIGSCNPCHAVISDVIAEHNAVGFSGSNAGGDLFVVQSVWRHNRVGIAPNSIDLEPRPPQSGIVIAANRVTGSSERDTPRSDEFESLAGVGIAVLGGSDDVVTKNRVRGQARVGILVASNPGIAGRPWLATGNQVTDNVVARSGLADLASIGTTPDGGNQFTRNRARRTTPVVLDGHGFFRIRQRAARPFRRTPVPARQPGMPDAGTAAARPATAEPTVRVDVGALGLP